MRNLIKYLFLLALISACASKEKRMGPEELPAYLSDQNSTPLQGSQPELIPGGATAPGEERSHRVTLVAGGAGVSSWAVVGFLKRLVEEGLTPDAVVGSGWAGIWVQAFAHFRSIHDVEWFAMRFSPEGLKEKDLLQGELPKAVISAFPEKNIEDFKRSLALATGAVGDPISYFDQGDWQRPLARTFLLRAEGGRPKPIAVDEALRRGSRVVIAFTAYDDYFTYLMKQPDAKKQSAAFVREARRELAEQSALAQVVATVKLGLNPTDYSARRAAILAGYKEAKRLSAVLRKALK